MESSANTFYIKDCALSAIATGDRAFSLKELYDILTVVHSGCIFYHFWSGALGPTFASRDYHNDFATWAYKRLRNQVLAERLSVLDPTNFVTIEDLRKALLNIIEISLDEVEEIPWVPKGFEFHFVRSRIIIFNTPYTPSKPEDLLAILPELTSTSIFYHFIDAYQRTPLHDDFSLWLESFGAQYQPLVEMIRNIDFYFISLKELQSTLEEIFKKHFKK